MCHMLLCLHVTACSAAADSDEDVSSCMWRSRVQYLCLPILQLLLNLISSTVVGCVSFPALISCAVTVQTGMHAQARIGRVQGNKYLYLGTFNSEMASQTALKYGDLRMETPCVMHRNN